jgi:chromosomal replication initiation ATPase DnaA
VISRPYHPAVTAVAMASAVPAAEILGRSRRRHVVMARFAAQILLREHYRMSLVAAAETVGRHHHTTTLNALAAAERPDVAYLVDKATELLGVR